MPRGQACAFLRDFLRFGGARIPSTVLLVVAGSIVEGFGLALLVPVLTLLVHVPGQPRGVAGRWLDARMAALPADWVLPVILGLFCVIVALRAVILLHRDRRTDRLAFGFADAQRSRVVEALAAAPWSELTGLRHAEVMQVLSSEIANVAVGAHLLPQITVAAVMVAAQLAVLVVVSPPLAGVALLFAVAGMIALGRLTRSAARTGVTGARATFRIADQVAALLGGLKFAAAHDLRDDLGKRLRNDAAALTALRLGERRRHSLSSITASSVAALAGVLLFAIGNAIGVSAVALLAGLAIVLRMSGPMRTLQTSVPQFAALMPAYAAVKALCATLARAPDTGDRVTDVSLQGTIVAHGLRFAYPGDDRGLFAGVDITIAPGETIGLAGPSGTGKTTLLDILAGLRLPDAGVVSVAGIPLTPALLPRWRQHLAYVTQDAYLFDDSLRRNLAWGAMRSDDAAMHAALAATGLAALVEALPEGLETRVAERGLRFSGGQRQRFALARAILRRPSLLLLDEATGALDLAAERTVLAGVRAALPEAAIVLVAHRRETLAICDRVVTLTGAHVVHTPDDRGTYGR